MKQNEKENENKQKLSQEELENVNGGHTPFLGGPGKKPDPEKGLRR